MTPWAPRRAASPRQVRQRRGRPAAGRAGRRGRRGRGAGAPRQAAPGGRRAAPSAAPAVDGRPRCGGARAAARTLAAATRSPGRLRASDRRLLEAAGASRWSSREGGGTHHGRQGEAPTGSPRQPDEHSGPGRTAGRPPGASTDKGPHGRRHHAPAPRERRPLRAPDQALEPEDEALHLHRAQRHLHHRPDPDAGPHRPRLRLRQGDRRARRHDHVRRHQAAGAGGHRRAGRPRRDALRHRALARRHAHQLPDRLQAPAAPQGARAHRADRRPDGADEEGGAGPAARAHQAHAHPRRHP